LREGGVEGKCQEPDHQPLASHTRTLVAIPARWGSTRFPGKALHHIAEKPLVQHVWERCRACREVDDIIIATDDDRIVAAAAAFGARAIMTSPEHPSGTDRIAEAMAKCGDYEVVINVQGDEPLISPSLIDELARVLRQEREVQMITAAAPIHDAKLVNDPNVVKVVTDVKQDALYFSRSPLPYVRNADARLVHKRHMGIYGFRREFLLEFVSWPQSMLECVESLEQLRAVEQGVKIRVVMTDDLSPGVDTLEQAQEVEKLIQASRS
jgi:3-deoxy-manno-octulosonate cytidylyltransferase (CMP-KDO synthetase)